MTTTPIQQPVPGGAGKKSNALIITLSIVGGLLLLAAVALVFLLIGRGAASGDEGQALATSAAPSPTPTPTPTEAAPAPPAPEEQDTSPRFTSFDAVTEVQCPQDGEKPEIQFSWATANAVEVWYTSGHEDAVVDNYMQVPLAGSQADLTDEHLFPCNHRGTQDYTITLVGDNGEHVSEFWTVTDLNWQG